MKIIINKILLFIALFALFNILYLQYLKNFNEGFKKTLEISNMKDSTYDCIILGNSVVYDGIDAEYLTEKGVSSYNFALGGENLKSSYIQIEQYIKNNRKPRLVLLGLSPSTPYYKNVDTILHPIVAYCYNQLDKYYFRSMPVIKFQWLAVEFFKIMISKAHRDAVVINGQLKTQKTIPDDTHYSKDLKQNISIKDFLGAKYLFKIDSLCKTNGIELYVLGMPGYRITQNEAPIGIHLLNYKDNNNLVFINLNNKEFCSKTFDPNKDWLGNSHLNEYGAKKLTKYLYKEYLINYNKN